MLADQRPIFAGVDSVKTGEVLKIAEHLENFPEELGEYLLAVTRRSAA